MDTGTQFEFNIPNLLKISLPLLIILEITKLTSYYYQFNLPIVEYLDFSEASILFLDEIITYLFFLLLIIICLTLFEGYITGALISAL